jgi:hypothetical protein
MVLACLPAACLEQTRAAASDARPSKWSSGSSGSRSRASGHHGEEWPALLRDPATQLDTARIYARHLPALGTALNDLVAAGHRRRRAPRLRP